MVFDADRTLSVTFRGGSVSVDMHTFETLLGNSVASSYADYESAVLSGRIAFSALVRLARVAAVPYSLLFAPRPVVEEQVRLKRAKLLQGVPDEPFMLNTRTRIELSEIELIVKDLIQKKSTLKDVAPELGPNHLVGVLKNRTGSAEQLGEEVVRLLAISRDTLAGFKTKREALEYLIQVFERNHIFVSRSVKNWMPQQIRIKFSGLTLRDRKAPIVFLAGGDHSDDPEPTGRQIFTLVLLGVLVLRGRFTTVTYDAHGDPSGAPIEYDIVGQVLMPREALSAVDLSNLDAVRALSDRLKVTPSAVCVRAARLKLIPQDVVDLHLRTLREARPPTNVARSPKPGNALRKYNGVALSRRMFVALDAGAISEGNFRRIFCGNKRDPQLIQEFREALG